MATEWPPVRALLASDRLVLNSSRHNANRRDVVGWHGRPALESLQDFQAPSWLSGLRFTQDVQKTVVDRLRLPASSAQFHHWLVIHTESTVLFRQNADFTVLLIILYTQRVNTASLRVEVPFSLSSWPFTLHGARIWRVRSTTRNNPVN